MKYTIEENKDGINIELGGAIEKKELLLEAFRECREGRCRCPSKEYSKLESLEIEEGDKTIRLRLKARPGEEIDKYEINKCLEYTETRVENEK